jgi:VCBS repeat-containing protein
MKYFEKSASFAAVLFLTACGGGGGGSTPLELTVASFTEFKLTENSLGSWPIEASVNKSASPISHSISGGPDSGDFAISGNILSFTGSANYEAASDLNKDGVYEVYVTTSSGTASSTQTIYIRVTDVAEAPTISTTAISNTPENSSAVATITASDEDRNSVLSYSLVNSGGSKDEGLLSIDSATGAVNFIAAPNFEAPGDLNADNTVDFTVMVSDGALSAQSDFTFSITNVNEAPIIATTSIANKAEGITALASISASDPDASSSLSFSLVNSEGLKDEGLLSINSSSGSITFIAAPNYESPSDIGGNNTIEFSIQVSDGSLSATQSYSLSITNVNEAPTISSASFSIAEQSTAVGSISGSDPDASTTLTYSLASGSAAVDDAKFSINSSTGAVSFLATPNFESPTDNGLDNVYNFTVNVSDGSLSSSQAVAVTVGNVNESPSFSLASAQSYTENSTSSISVVASDPDGSSVLTYSLSGSDASRFTISSAGALSFASTPDYESPADNGGNNVYNVSVGVSDGSISSTVALVITVSDSTADNFGIQLPANVALAELQKENE